MADFGKPKFDQDKGKFDGSNHGPTFPGKPGTPEYIKAVKTYLSGQLVGDQLGEDTNGDGKYKGKGLAFGEGGRAQMLMDRITVDLVSKGYDFNKAQSFAKMKVGQNYQNKLQQANGDKAQADQKKWDKPKIEEVK